MAKTKAVVVSELNTVFNGDRWSQRDLYDYLFMRDWVGPRQLYEHLPYLSQWFAREFEGITEWMRDIRRCRAAVMDAAVEADVQTMIDEAAEAEAAAAEELHRQWLELSNLLNAVESAEENIQQMFFELHVNAAAGRLLGQSEFQLVRHLRREVS